jgi:hypothetical protein
MSADSPVAILYDALGNPVEVESFAGKYHLSSIIRQSVATSATNTSSANLAAGATFTGTSESTYGVVGIQINMYADQPVRVRVEQSNDQSNWDIVDEWDLLAGHGDGRTVQATSEYFRVIVENLGHSTTTEFRLQSVLCPIADPLPRSLGASGALKMSRQTTSYVPDSANFSNITEPRALVQDSGGNLSVRAGVLTDEESFRDDFTDGAIYEDLTGTCYFRNGSNHVTGSGTSFLDELVKGEVIKLSTDPDSNYALIEDVFSDTDLLLAEDYGGSTGNGTGREADWMHMIGTGCSITQASSKRNFLSGTASGEFVEDVKVGDYLPYVLTFTASITQRIANQEGFVGFMNDDPTGVTKQARLVFKGTDNTVVTLRTSFNSTDVSDRDVTLPFGGTTADLNEYQIELTGGRAVLWVNKMRLAEETYHIPGPYDVMDIHMGIWNSGVVGGSTTLALDTIFFTNFNRVDIALTPQGEPLSVQELRSSVPSLTNVSAAVADTLLLSANAARIGATIYNDSTAILYLTFGSGASPTSFTVRMPARSYFEVPYRYTGQINGYWSVANGTARVTELA